MIQFIGRDNAFLDEKRAYGLEFIKERKKEHSRDLEIRQVRFETLRQLVQFESRGNAFLDEKPAHGLEFIKERLKECNKDLDIRQVRLFLRHGSSRSSGDLL